MFNSDASIAKSETGVNTRFLGKTSHYDSNPAFNCSQVHTVTIFQSGQHAKCHFTSEELSPFYSFLPLPALLFNQLLQSRLHGFRDFAGAIFSTLNAHSESRHSRMHGLSPPAVPSHRPPPPSLHFPIRSRVGTGLTTSSGQKPGRRRREAATARVSLHDYTVKTLYYTFTITLA